MADACTHNGDDRLMRSLGLRTTDFGRGYTDIGTVVVEEAEPGRAAATVRVEVGALPAQFFRFTVTRPEETADGGGDDEVFVITTGTGTFGEFWPTAMLLAQNAINVSNG